MISRALEIRIRRFLVAFVLVGVGVTGLAPPSSAASAREAFVITDPTGDASNSVLFGDVGLQTDEISSSRSWSFGSTKRRARVVPIAMSNFRYCVNFSTPIGYACHAGQFGYARHTAVGGALPGGPNNEAGIIDVRPGDRVVWSNVDAICDFNDGSGPSPSPIDCPGHDVVFEDGSVRSPRLPARHRSDVTKPARKPATFAWVVPAKTRPGKLWRYFCSEFDRSEAHADGGMTGVLRVV